MSRIALRARSVAASLALAASTLAGVVAVFVALLPAALRGGPEGRRIASIRRPEVAAEPPPAPPAEQASVR